MSVAGFKAAMVLLALAVFFAFEFPTLGLLLGLVVIVWSAVGRLRRADQAAKRRAATALGLGAAAFALAVAVVVLSSTGRGSSPSSGSSTSVVSPT